VLSLNPAIEKTEALLVMSCGAGVAVVSKLCESQVYPALDTESIGGICGEETMKEQCALCGDCSVWVFGGVCPIVQCPKSSMNGSCGGASEGKCEVDERKCAWDVIYEKLKKLGKLEYLEIIHEPKDSTKKLRRQM
jgi:hypothetical protein